MSHSSLLFNYIDKYTLLKVSGERIEATRFAFGRRNDGDIGINEKTHNEVEDESPLKFAVY